MRRGIVIAAAAAGAIALSLLVIVRPWAIVERRAQPLPGASPAPSDAETRASPHTAPRIEPKPGLDAESAPSVGAPDRDHDLHGRVVNAADEPVAGATVAIIRNEARGVRLLDQEYTYAERAVVDATTDADGRFRFRLPQGRPFDLVVTAEGFPKTRLRDRYAGEFVIVKLAPGATLRGTITRAADREPVAHARLRAWRRSDGAMMLDGTTAADGRYEFAGLEAGVIVVDIVAPVQMSPPWTELRLEPGKVVQHDSALEDGPTVVGVVTDAGTGAAIPDAEVGENWTFRKSVRTGPDGKYLLRGVTPMNGDIHARAKGYGLKSLPLRTSRPGILNFDFALQRGRAVRGRIVTRDGSPVAGAYVAAGAIVHGPEGHSIDWPATRSGTDGRFEIADLRRDLAHALIVRKDGIASLVLDLPPTEASLDEIDLGDVAVDAAGSIRGVAIDSKGRPLPDMKLVLSAQDGTPNADRARLRAGEPSARPAIDAYFSDVRGRTDDLGRFRFTDLATGSYVVKRETNPPLNEPGAAVAVRAGETSELRLVVPARFSIKGRIASADGSDHPPCRVSAYAESEDRSKTDLAGSAGSSGSDFEIHELEEGTYTLVVFVLGELPRAAPVFARGVAAGAQDVRIVLTASAPITGSVVDADRAPVTNALVESFDPQSGIRVMTTRSLADGSFSLDVREGDTVRLLASAGEKTDPKVELPSIRAGTNNLLLSLPKKP